MKINSILLLTAFVLTLFFSSCAKVSIDGFDEKTWKADKMGCENNRESLAELIIAQKDVLRGKGQQNLKKLLGHPDKHELYSRNQKIFYYFLEPAMDCENALEKPKYLSIRFNALNQAGEILILDEEI